MPDGTLLYVSMTAKRVMAVSPGGEPVVHADLSQIATHSCNDMVVSVAKHAYVGNFGFDLENQAPFETGTLAHIVFDGAVRRVEHPLAFPNGSVITPDGPTLIVGETFGGQYTALTSTVMATRESTGMGRVPVHHPTGVPRCRRRHLDVRLRRQRFAGARRREVSAEIRSTARQCACSAALTAAPSTGSCHLPAP